MITFNIFTQFIPVTILLLPISFMGGIVATSWTFLSSSSHWLIGRQHSLPIFIKLVFNFLSPTNSGNSLSWLPLLITLFLICLCFNLLSLIPYSFSHTSHLSFTFSLSLPLWISVTTLGIISNWKNKLTHLVPQGTPIWLIPLMVIIETLSLFIQPLTLGFRLGANLLAGHLLIFLCSCVVWQAFTQSFTFGIISSALIIILLLLEIAVAFIQATVFFILSKNYLEDNLT
uniref:ATP synthase subunit a n=1 Tax=Aspidophiura sp. TaxID=3135528 RepID=A0AAU6QDB5_9ECHI